jgi:hypothetical protein
MLRVRVTKALEGTWAAGGGEPRVLSLELGRKHLVMCLVHCVLVTTLDDGATYVDLEDDEEVDDTQRKALVFPSRDMATDAGAVMRQTAFQLRAVPESAPAPSNPGPRVDGLTRTTGPDERSGFSRQLHASLAFETVKVHAPEGMAGGAAQSTALVLWGMLEITQQRFNAGKNSNPPCCLVMCLRASGTARISPSGRHLALANEFGIVYLIEDFSRVERGMAIWPEITTRITFPSGTRHMEWEDEGRLVVQTVRSFILSFYTFET